MVLRLSESAQALTGKQNSEERDHEINPKIAEERI